LILIFHARLNNKILCPVYLSPSDSRQRQAKTTKKVSFSSNQCEVFTVQKALIFTRQSAVSHLSIRSLIYLPSLFNILFHQSIHSFPGFIENHNSVFQPFSLLFSFLLRQMVYWLAFRRTATFIFLSAGFALYKQ